MNGDGCTGVLVTHQDGSIECLDFDCTDDDMRRHDWRLACTDLGEPCGACLGRRALGADFLDVHQRVA